MATASPPKPWERARGSAAPISASIASPTATAVSAPSNMASSTTMPNSSSSSTAAPVIPQRPSNLSNVVNRTASTYANNGSTFANRAYGTSPYASSPYGMSSPYSRMSGGYGGYGGMGSSMYGSSMYGSGMYGGMGGMYGGGMYGGMGGMGGMQDPNDPNSMTNNFAQSTQATFQIIESIVGAFGGFAQMLESTYMATHSSFFAMVQVAEQFGNLRQTLGSILGIYTVLRWMRTLIAKVTGRPPPADAMALTPSNFAAFTGSPAVGPNGAPLPPKPSKKPFIVFLLAAFGLPYLMGKLIRTLAKGQELQEQQQQQQQGNLQFDEHGQPIPTPLDPSKLDFCRVLYDFPPPDALANGSFDSALDLSVTKGDLVAVLDKSDPNNPQSTSQGEWWRCRARDGRMGYLPAVYLETIQRKPQPAQITGSERAQTMSGESTGRAQTLNSTIDGPGSSRANTMAATTVAPKQVQLLKAEEKAKGLENFQKAWVNDR